MCDLSTLLSVLERVIRCSIIRVSYLTQSTVLSSGNRSIGFKYEALQFRKGLTNRISLFSEFKFLRAD